MRQGKLRCLAILLLGVTFWGKTLFAVPYRGEEPGELYARSAVLMDADSGRILYEKNGYERRPMASTTKIMTCILALEAGQKGQQVRISKEAVRQPAVKLGVQEGQTFYLGDLLYSLMLESHNDTAVAVAEEISGSVQAFAGRMNEKAKSLGCRETHFVTPNGLDEADAEGAHATTGVELAKIMRYCIRESEKAKEFLEITQTPSYDFSDVEGKRQYHCENHNAFLTMMEGALSGKTGFTGEAGYCYVGALSREGKTYIVSLLACGWPGHKTWKWSDTKKLMDYGLAHYDKKTTQAKSLLKKVLLVAGGIPREGGLFAPAKTGCAYEKGQVPQVEMLLRKQEKIEVTYEIADDLTAPVKAGMPVGKVRFFLNGKEIENQNIVATENVAQLTWKWYVRELLEELLL